MAQTVALKVIHVGVDLCHRLPVLESAGYEVETCASALELRDALSAEEELDAVLICERAEGAHPEAVLLTRSQSSAPIVLFRETQSTFAESSFDLVVPNLVPPQVWLAEMAALIERTRALRAESLELKTQAAVLRRESAAARARSRAERARSRLERLRNAAPAEGLGPDAGTNPEKR